MTAWTIEYPDVQWHLLPVSTLAACLTRIGRIDFDKLPPSFFRFVGQLAKECRPRGVCNAFGKAMIVRHPVDLQVFDCYHTKSVNDLATVLMGEIIPSERYPFMHPCHDLPMFPTFRCAFCQLAMLALDSGKSLFLFAEKARIAYLFFIAESSKGFEPNINTHLGRGFWQAKRLTFDREGNIPFAGTATSKSTRFHLALDRAMIDHLDAANLGKHHAAIMGDAETTLREGEAIIAVSPAKTGVARLFASDPSPKEGFEGQVNTDGYILQHLRMHLFQWRAFLFQQSQRINLMIARERLPLLLIGCFAFLKKMVVEPTTLIQGLVELVNLFLRRKDTVLKHFMHASILAQSRTYLNSFSPPAGGAPSIPVAGARGLTARFDKWRAISNR